MTTTMVMADSLYVAYVIENIVIFLIAFQDFVLPVKIAMDCDSLLWLT